MKLSEETISNEVIANAPRVHMSRRQIICGLAAGSVVPIVTSCTTNPETGSSQFLLVGEDAIASMATSAWTEMKQQTPQTKNSALKSRVNRVWNKISHGAGRADQDWDVAVFDTDDVNAFVMPGNKVGVYRGITELVENDDQLSSVLGHEVGHVAGRHAAERYSVAMAGQIAMVAGAIAVNQSDTLRDYGSAIGALGGAALQFGVLLPYSRRHELEADRLGVDYMHNAGYRVAEAPRLWDLMAEKGGARQPEFMSTHPDPLRRAEELRNYINAKNYDLV
ncbi:MAG: peptidase M48 [Ponticaulis sp.]|nr:peptidase M48 [Ponticaulis sp.]